jgi:hypothetical protein
MNARQFLLLEGLAKEAGTGEWFSKGWKYDLRTMTVLVKKGFVKSQGQFGVDHRYSVTPKGWTPKGWTPKGWTALDGAVKIVF